MKMFFQKRKNKRKNLIGLSLIAVALVVLSACSTNDKNEVSIDGKTPVSVTFEGNIPATLTKTSVVPGFQEVAPYLKPGSATIDSLSISEVKILISQLELEANVDDNDDALEDSLEFESEPFVLQFTPDSSTSTLTKKLPVNGTYNEIEVEIESLDEDETPVDAIFQGGEDGYSIAVKGTFNDASFLFRVNVEADLELELNPPITLDGKNPVEVKIGVNVADWFVDADGNVLDPSVASNKDLIMENIKNSFEGSNWEWDD